MPYGNALCSSCVIGESLWLSFEKAQDERIGERRALENRQVGGSFDRMEFRRRNRLAHVLVPSEWHGVVGRAPEEENGNVGPSDGLIDGVHVQTGDAATRGQQR